MKHPHFAFAFLPSLLLLGPVAAQDTITLTPPRVGASMAFVQRTSQLQDIDVGGQTFAVSQEITQEFTVAITAAGDDNGRTVKVTLGRTQGAIDSPQGRVEYDSSKKGGDDEETGMQAGVERIAGKEFTAKIDADGIVSDLAGFADTAAAARKAAGDQANILESLVSDRALSQLVRAALGPLPKATVAVGASWDRGEDTGSTVPMRRSLHCSLVSFDAATAEIAIAGTIEAKKDEPAKGPMASAKIEDGKITGKVTVSRKDSFAMRNEAKATITFLAMGGRIEVTSTTVIDRAGAKVEAAPPAEKPAAEKPADKAGK